MPAQGKDASQETLEIRCPCCRTKLTVDAASGEILLEERPKRSGVSWEDALQAGRKRSAEAEEQFRRNIERERHADELLEKKFREALKKADKSDSPPPRIFDLD